MTRLLAAEALARIGGPARVAIPALNRVSVDQNTYVRREASWAAGVIQQSKEK
jgi:hypothetical protein